jgi:hypothetical protein
MEQRNRRGALGAMLAVPVGIAAVGASSEAGAKPKGGEMANQLDMLLSKDSIRDILFAYARSNDRADEALLRNCFWPESTHKHGRFEGKSSDFVGFAFKIISALKYACHHISNVSIEVRGDRAFSECYYFAQHRRAAKEGGGEEDVFFQGRYLDDFERRNGVWKIIRRRGLSDFTSDPLPARTMQADWPAGQHSEKFPGDDYYAMRQAFLAR